jgi:hypothetical protein
MAAYLAAADAHRLVNVFLLNRPTAPVNLEPAPFERRWLRLATMAFWVLFVGYELYSEVHGGWQFYKEPRRTPSGCRVTNPAATSCCTG